MITIFKYLHGEQIFDNGLSSLAEDGKTQPNSWKLKLHEFRLEMRHTFLRGREINHWNNVPRSW